MSEKYKKTCEYLNYVQLLLILFSTVTGCALISAFGSLVRNFVGFAILQKDSKFAESLQE